MAVLIILVVGLAAYLLSFVIWPQPASVPGPPPDLLPIFAGVLGVYAFMFGAGVAFLVFGMPLMRRARQPGWLTWAAFISMALLLLQGWPHENLHRITNGQSYAVIARIEVGVHLPVIVATLILAYFFARWLVDLSATTAPRRVPQTEARDQVGGTAPR